MKRVVLRVLVALIVLLGVGYGVGLAWFGLHYVPGTTVNGIDASMMDDETLAVALENAVGSWQGTVTSKGGFELELSAESVGLAVDGEAMAAEARAAIEPWKWPYLLLSPTAIEVDERASFDEDTLRATVDAAVAAFDKGATKPSDAELSFDEPTGTWSITTAEPGTALDAEAVFDEVRVMVAAMDKKLALSDATLEAATRGEDDAVLVATRDAANALAGHNLSFVFDGKEVNKLRSSEIAGWVLIDDEMQVSLDEDAIWVWIDEELSDVAASEDDLHVYVLDQERAVEDTLAALRSDAHDVSVELVAEVDMEKPPLSEGARGRGRHLDVNLATQYARLYDSSSKIIWESYIVSGDTSTGHDTPTGDFTILSKQTSRWLIGDDENGDGEPDYRNFVDYWMLFREGGYGLHDASWRSYFGGDIYTYAGSHGCINLPPSRAAELYGLIRVGDRVYVHF